MPVKPATLPEWNSGGANRTTPPGGKLTLGYVFGEEPSSSYDNWFQNLVYQWTQYLNAPVGNGTTPAMEFAAGVGISGAGGIGIRSTVSDIFSAAALFGGRDVTPNDIATAFNTVGATGGPGAAIYAYGNSGTAPIQVRNAGSGSCINATSLANGQAITASGGSSTGPVAAVSVQSPGGGPGISASGSPGVQGIANTNQNGVVGSGNGLGHGVVGNAGATGVAILGNGSSSLGAGPAIRGISNRSGVNGVEGTGNGAGSGVLGTGGVTGPGVTATSGATSGPALVVTPGNAVTAGMRMTVQAAPTGAHLVGDMYMATGGVLKVCTVAGTPGTFVSVGTQT